MGEKAQCNQTLSPWPGWTERETAMQNPDENEIERAIIAADLREILAAYSSRINADIERIKLSPLTIYCAKTGQPIGTVARATLETVLATHGRHRAEEILLNGNLNAHHPAWHFVDNTSLDRLMSRDPQGYAVYCLNILCNIMGKAKHVRAAQYTETHWQLARAWQYLSFLSPLQLDALNDALCACITFSPHAFERLLLGKEIAKAATQADKLAKLAIDGTLVPALEKAVETAMEILHRWDIESQVKRREVQRLYDNRPKTPWELANGPSNIRLQKRARRHVEKQNAIKIETEFSIGLMQFMSETRLPKSNWLARKITAIKTQPLGVTALDLSEVSELGNFEFNETFDDDNDNTVEVRTISHEELRAMRGEQVTKPNAPTAPHANSKRIEITTHKAQGLTYEEAARLNEFKPVVPTLTVRERLARNAALQETKRAEIAAAKIATSTKPELGKTLWARLQAKKGGK